MTDVLNSGPARAGAFAAAIVILIFPALLNGFPFVLDDTMDYVALYPVVYRSTFYSLFVNATDLQFSPWLTIIVQALIISHLLWLWVRIVARETSPFLLPALALLLTLGSSLGYVTSYLMPDIFTSVLLLSTTLLLFARDDLAKRERLYLSLLIGLSVSVHLSHIPILALTVAPLAAALLIAGESLRDVARRCIPIGLPAAIAAALLFTSHIVLFGIAKLSPAGPVFFLASLIGNGPAANYLREACPEANYRICAEIEHLPGDSNSFLWGGLLYKLGSFTDYREEAETIVSETIKSRPLEVAGMAISSFGRALMAHAPAADFRPLGWNMWRVETSISKYGPATLERFRESAQVKETIPKAAIKAVDDIVLPASLLVLLGLLAKASLGSPRDTWIAVAVLLGVTVNIFICSVFSGVFDRYQTRVTWLIPLLALLFTWRLWRERSQSLRTLSAAQAA